MAERVFEIKVKTDTDGAVSDVNELGHAIEEVGDDAKKVQSSASKSLNKIGQEAKKSAQDTEQAFNQAQDKVSSAADVFTGGLFGQFKAIKEGIQSVVPALKGLRGAILATGIGALLVALGEVIANWDDIKKSIRGVNEETEEQINKMERLRAETKLQYDLIVASEASLRLQGKTEEQIVQLKKEALEAQLAVSESNVRTYGIELARLETAQKRARLERENLNLVEKLAGRGILIDNFLNYDEDIADARLKYEESLLGFTQLRASLDQIELTKQEEANQNQAVKIETLKTEVSELDKIIARREMLSAAEIRGAGDIAAPDMIPLEVQQAQVTTEMLAEEYNRRLEMERNIEAMRFEAKKQATEGIINLFGAESKAGRAATVLRQVLAAQELIAEARKTITFAKLKGAQANASITAGAASTASVGFPQNIPLLAAYAVQAAGIISSIRSAVRAAGATSDISAPSFGGGGFSGGQAPNPANAVDLNFLNQQPPVQAYVLQDDLKSNAEASQRIRDLASL